MPSTEPETTPSAAPTLSRYPLLSDRQGFDRRWYAPALNVVYTPANAADVVTAMTAAIQAGYQPGQIQITCGRHCYEDFVYNANTRCIIDMTGLRSYGYDPSRGYYMDVGNGNWDMYRTLNNVYGRTLPAGSCYSVGLGGHVTGGGYGILSRLYGLVIDYVTGADVVVMPAANPNVPQLVFCSSSQNPELYWAIRGGGGGNFGIITRYYFANPPYAPQNLYVQTLTIPWSNFTSVQAMKSYLDTFFEINCKGAPPYDFSIFHLNHIQAGSCTVSTFRCYDPRLHGEQGAFESDFEKTVEERRGRYEALGPLSNEPGPHIGHPVWLADNGPLMPEDSYTYRNYTFLEGVQQANGSGPNRFGKYKSAYMKAAFPVDQVAALYKWLQINPAGLPANDMAASLCQIDSYGGQINYWPSNATAIPQRSSLMKLQYQTYWDNASPVGQPDEAQGAAHVNWLNGMYTEVYAAYGGFPDPRAPGAADIVDGCYFNYCDSALGTNQDGNIGRAMYLYYKENFARLKAAKGYYNPKDWFRSAQSIPYP